MIRAGSIRAPARRVRPAPPRRGGGGGGEILLPIAAGSAGAGGLVAVQSPLVALGLSGGLVLTFLPWALLCALVFLAATQQLVSLNVGGVTLRFEQMLLVPFFIRAILLTNARATNRWKLAEFFLLSFIAFEIFTTYANGFLYLRNFLPIGLSFFGAIAYLTVSMSISTRRRLIVAARVLLIGVVINAAIGLVAFVASVALGTDFLVSKGQKEILKPAFALSYESNIFGSTCAAGALIFLALWRERNPVFSKRVSLLFFTVAFGGMIASLTRGAWIGFVVVFVLFLLFPRKGTRRAGGAERAAALVMLLPVLAFGIAYVAATSESASEDDVASVVGAKASESFNFTEGTGRGRLVEWTTAYADIRTSPIIGLGVNAYSAYHPSTGGDGRPAYIGNLWVRVLYEGGIVGLLLFAGFITAVLFPNRALFVSRGDLAPIARALTFGWAVLTIAYIGTDSMLLLWPWLLLGLTRAARTLADRQYASIRAAVRRSAGAQGNGGSTGERPPRLVPPGPAPRPLPVS